MKLLLSWCLPMVLPAMLSAAPLPIDDGVRVVASLYRDFAWEVLSVGPLGGEPGFIDQPRSVLERYLAPSLVAAIIKDRACVERTGEVCELNFMPLWNSQDASPSDLRVALARKDQRCSSSSGHRPWMRLSPSASRWSRPRRDRV